MADIAKLCLQKSRIPHLAFSISTRRTAAPSRTQCTNQRQLRISSSSQGVAGLKSIPPLPGRIPRHSRHASTTTNPSFPNLPRAQSQASQTPLPTLAQRAAAEQSLREQRARASRQRFAMSSNTYLWICSLFGFALSTYIVYTYQSYRGALKKYEQLDLPQNADVSSRWMDMSRNFDDEVELSEMAMWLRSKRENLCREAKGHVLEVSAGTGRNMDCYRLDPALMREDRKVKSLVFNDLSEIMLYQAQKKFDASQEKIADEKRKFPGAVQFVVGDAGDKRLIKRPEGGFDTIVQTMGICSETNAVAFLERLGELCRQPGEQSTGVDASILEKEAQQQLEAVEKARDYGADDPDQESARLNELIIERKGDLGGKILLLEHGRSNYGIVNRVLDNGAKMHADHYGCWWNKDIEQVIKDSGLIVERKRRYHFGTTYEYVLWPRPRSDLQTSNERIDNDGQTVDVNVTEAVKARGGWFGKG